MSSHEEMMMLYDKLNINEKRNEFSSLLEKKIIYGIIENKIILLHEYRVKCLRARALALL